MPAADPNKLMTTQEAIRRFVKDGDHLVIGTYTVGMCYTRWPRSSAWGRRA
jgi:hypothetical protein